MRVFVAGASGAIGTRLVPQLIARGHEVIGSSRAIYNIVDDEPAAVRVWLPEVAKIVGAKPPRHFPRWLARLFAGDALVTMGTESRGASNTRAKRELGWTLCYPSWRQGFAELYAEPIAPVARPIQTQ